MKNIDSRYEYSQGASNKFWTVKFQPGNSFYTVTYGKIGSNGVTKRIEVYDCGCNFDDCHDDYDGDLICSCVCHNGDKVYKYCLEKIKEKTDKGYKLITTKKVKAVKKATPTESLPAGVTKTKDGLYKKIYYGTTTYYKDAKLVTIHRLDGPAVKDNNSEAWIQDGVLHREDGPASITKYRTEYRIKGKLHRTDGPAVITNTHVEYWVDGKQHRLDGPAVEYKNGDFEYWVNNEHHRVDGPAVKEGKSESYYQNGKYHREDGPAYIDEDLEQWFLNGKLHRTDGPAEINKYYGESEYFLHGKRVYFEKYIAKCGKKIETSQFSHLLGKKLNIGTADGIQFVEIVDHKGHLSIKKDKHKLSYHLYELGDHWYSTYDETPVSWSPSFFQAPGSYAKIAPAKMIPGEVVEKQTPKVVKSSTFTTVATQVAAAQAEKLIEQKLGIAGKMGAQLANLAIGHALPKAMPSAAPIGKSLRVGAMTSLGTNALEKLISGIQHELKISNPLEIVEQPREVIEEKIILPVEANHA